jgi:hypothetical protein
MQIKPLPRIGIVVAVTAICCQLLFTTMSRELTQYTNHVTERLTELLRNKTNHDLLFIGSSRTHTNIYPKVFDDSLGVNSYNAGIEGGNLLVFNMILDAYLRNHPPPKHLVLTLDLHSFSLKNKIFNYADYLPYLDNVVIDSTLSANGFNTSLQKIVPFVRLTDYDDFSKNIAWEHWQGKRHQQIPKADFQYKGYLSNTEKYITAIKEPELIYEMEIADSAIVYLNKIIQTCKRRNIGLIFTYAPEFRLGLQKQIKNAPKILAVMENIARQNQIPFFRDDRLAICDNPKLFANNGHLNKQGAAIYSAILAQQLKPLIQ